MSRDVEAYLVGPNQSRRAQDGISTEQILRMIRGWKYDGSVADAALNLQSVWRAKFSLANVVRSFTTDAVGGFRIHNAASAGTLQSQLGPNVPYFPRCMNDDRVWLCAGDGRSPSQLYSGANLSTAATGTIGTLVGQATLSGGTFSAIPPIGSFVGMPVGVSANPIAHFRALESSISSATLEDMLASTALAMTVAFRSFGFPFPCVPIYEAGTVTFDNATSTITGYGTKWSTGGIAFASAYDMVLIKPPGAKAVLLGFGAVGSDTSLTSTSSGTSITTKSPYAILRACPFVDAVSHRGSLFGIEGADGVHPNRVSAFPQGWNPSMPPGFVPPFDTTVTPSSDNPDDFTAFPIEVPTPFHGDPNMALNSSPQGLLVHKRKDTHIVFGDYPNFSQQLFAGGAGCIDRRSVLSLAGMRAWGGESGFYVEDGGQPRDITEATRFTGGINGDWRALTDGFVDGTDFCVTGEVYGHLVIGMTTDAGATHILYLYDLTNRTWMCEVTNCIPRFFFTSKIAGEAEKLLWVGDAQQGRVMDLAPAINGTGFAKNGDGTAPRLQYESGTGLAEAGGIEGEALVGDVDLSANVYDVGAPGATQMTVTLEHGGGVRQGSAQEVKTLDPILSDATDRVDRHERRANRSGRQLQVKLDTPTVGTNDVNTTVEVAEIVLELFDAAGAT